MTPEALKRVSALWDLLERQPRGDTPEAWLGALAPDDQVHASVLLAMWRHAQSPSDGLSGGVPPMEDAPAGEPAGSRASGDLIGPYRLSLPLGRGGMGEVWLARRDDGLVDREVAIKLPLLLTNQVTLRQRFERERNILAGLTHPRIARLYDAGITPDGQPYMALEYVEGEPITDYCDRRQLSPATRVDLFLQVLDAVQYAHSRLVIHRDLKPSNILVTADGEVRLLDFGIAKMLDDDSDSSMPGTSETTALTRLGGHALTLEYASPEQILRQPVGTVSDVYSLGVLFFELMTGERPCQWRQTTREALETAVLDAPRPLPSSRVVERTAALRAASPRALVRQLRGDLDTIALKALKVVAKDRYPTAAAFAQDLQRWRDGDAVLARPDSRWYRASRFVRRNRLVVGSATLVIAGLSVGLGAALWQARAARLEARTAQVTEAFLTELFQANSLEQDDPVKAQRATARDLLDRGSRRVAQSLNDAPEAKLRLLKTLAGLNRGLALDDTAYVVQRQRLDLYLSLHPQASNALAREYIDAAEAAYASSAAVGQAAGLLNQAEQMLDGLEDHTSFERGRAELQRGNQAGGDNCAALPHARRGVAILRRFPASGELAEGLLLLSQGHTYCGDAAAALAAAEESIAMLQGLQQRRLLPDAYKMVAKAQMRRGKMAASFAAGRKALQMVEAQHAADTSPGSDVMNAVASLTVGLVACAQPADALAVLEPRLRRALADPSDTDPDSVVAVLIQKANALLALDRPDEAMRTVRTAQHLLGTFESAQAQRVMVEDTAAEIQLATGELSQAAASLARATAMHDRLHHTGSPQNNRHLSARVRYAVRAGDLAAASRDLQAFIARPLASGQASRSQFEQRLLQAEIAAGRRQWAEALTLSDALLSDIDRHPEPRFVRDQKAWAARLAGAALQALDRTAEAAARRRVAAQIFEAMSRADEPTSTAAATATAPESPPPRP
jgi:serine/threonine-protein kinase